MLRDRLAAEIDERGFNAELNSFTQTYDNHEVDAFLLQLPHTGESCRTGSRWQPRRVQRSNWLQQ